MTTTGTLRRWLQGTAGGVLVALGLSGLVGLWQGAATAQPDHRGRGHQTMHEMMDAMHGEGTAARMHQIDGADEMMDMMGDMDTSRMGEMMRDGGTMDQMMDGRGMSDVGGVMGRMMGSR